MNKLPIVENFLENNLLSYNNIIFLKSLGSLQQFHQKNTIKLKKIPLKLLNKKFEEHK